MTRRSPLSLAVAALAATAQLTTPAAAAPTGSATLHLSATADRALAARGIRLSVTAPGRRGDRDLVVPVRTLRTGATTTISVGGAIRLRRGTRSVTLISLRVVLGARTSVSAMLGGRRTTVWTLVARKGALTVDAATASARLVATSATLSRTAATVLARRLGGRALPRAKFVRLSVDAAGTAPATAPAQSSPATGQAAATCPLQRQGGTPTDVGAGEPSVKPRPATAIAVTGAAIAWHPRESFVRYIATGEGTTAGDGATADPPQTLPGTSAALSYTFRFPLASGWCDPATGRAALYGSGSVRFRYSAHGIDLVVRDPELEIDGASSRLIFRVTGSSADGRQVVETLDLGGSAAIAASPDGRTLDYAQLPGAVPRGAAAGVFAGYYLPGDEFGWASVSFSTP